MQIAPSYLLPGGAVIFYSGNAFKPIWNLLYFHPTPSLLPFPIPNIILMDKNCDFAGKGEISYLYYLTYTQKERGRDSNELSIV